MIEPSHSSLSPSLNELSRQAEQSLAEPSTSPELSLGKPQQCFPGVKIRMGAKRMEMVNDSSYRVAGRVSSNRCRTGASQWMQASWLQHM